MHCLRIQRMIRFTSGESSESAPRKALQRQDCIRPDMPHSTTQSFMLHCPGSIIIISHHAMANQKSSKMRRLERSIYDLNIVVSQNDTSHESHRNFFCIG